MFPFLEHCLGGFHSNSIEYAVIEMTLKCSGGPLGTIIHVCINTMSLILTHFFSCKCLVQ